MSDQREYTDEELDALYEAARKQTMAYQFGEASAASRGCLVAVFSPVLDWIVAKPIRWYLFVMAIYALLPLAILTDDVPSRVKAFFVAFYLIATIVYTVAYWKNIKWSNATWKK